MRRGDTDFFENNFMTAVTKNFNAAAPRYDSAATVQARVAQRLIDMIKAKNPAAILDLGCGTGFVAEAAARRWPQAALTALDNAPAMLAQASRKCPRVRFVQGDAAVASFPPVFDLVLSSMMAHWLPDPCAALARWRTFLKPEGQLAVALLTEGSFQEWRDLCAKAGVADGLWVMPPSDFAASLAPEITHEVLRVDFPSARAFLAHLKRLGAATPCAGHRPAFLRTVLRAAPAPFVVSYRVSYLTLAAARNNGTIDAHGTPVFDLLSVSA